VKRAIAAVTVLLRAASVGASRTFFNVYLDDGLGVSTANIGLLYAIIQLASAPAALAMPVLSKRGGNYCSAALVIASRRRRRSNLPWPYLGIALSLRQASLDLARDRQGKLLRFSQ